MLSIANNYMLSIKYFLQNFLVVKVVFHSFDFLIVFVPFSGNEYHVPFFCKHASRADRLAPVGDGDHLASLLRVESCQHIVDDGLWVLVARVVAREDHLVALSDGLLRHERSLAVVAVAASATDGDDLSLAVEHLVDGREHVGDGVRRVGVIDRIGSSRPLTLPSVLMATSTA